MEVEPTRRESISLPFAFALPLALDEDPASGSFREVERSPRAPAVLRAPFSSALLSPLLLEDPAAPTPPSFLSIGLKPNPASISSTRRLLRDGGGRSASISNPVSSVATAELFLVFFDGVPIQHAGGGRTEKVAGNRGPAVPVPMGRCSCSSRFRSRKRQCGAWVGVERLGLGLRA